MRKFLVAGLGLLGLLVLGTQSFAACADAVRTCKQQALGCWNAALCMAYCDEGYRTCMVHEYHDKHGYPGSPGPDGWWKHKPPGDSSDRTQDGPKKGQTASSAPPKTVPSKTAPLKTEPPKSSDGRLFGGGASPALAGTPARKQQ